MPAGPNKGPQPACVEDYDDDRNTVLSATRVHARAGKDGSDSGYSSRTGTVDGEHPESGHTADLKSRPVQIERTRMPYSSGPAARRQEPVDQPKPTRPKVAEEARPSREVNKKFRHPEGVCWTCDQVGYHVTQEQVNDIKKSLAGVKTSTTEKRKTTKEPPVIQTKHRDVDTKLRRMSSRRESHPVMQYPPSSTQPMSASYATPAPYYSGGYAPPLTPTGYPAQPSYAYAAYPPTPSTPSTAAYIAQPPRQEYFSQVAPEVAPPKRGRRASVYYDPDPRQPPYEHKEPAYPARETTYHGEVVDHRRATRSQAPFHASNRDTEHDVFEDRRRMPPPELPVERSDRTRRPSAQKHHTYDDSRPKMSYPGDMNRGVADEAWERPPSKDHPDYYQQSNRQPLSVRTHELVPSKSSASNRTLPEETPTRPKARQSVSYSHPNDIQTSAKNSAPRDTTQRRVTAPITNMDDKVAAAEAYQQKRSSMISDDLSTEKIKSMKSSKAPTRSDAGSNYSHRESCYSSSKDSTGAKKARRDSIVIETGSKSRPLSIQMPNGLTVQIGAEQDAAKQKEKEKEKRKSQKLLEHTPSSASGVSQSAASRSRAATSSHPSSDRDKDRDYQEKVSKRSSYITDSRPTQSPVKTTKSSRAPSRSRASSDADASRRRRQSVVSERIVLRS